MEGRTVRCAKCRHSWFQDGPELEPPEDARTRRGRPRLAFASAGLRGTRRRSANARNRSACIPSTGLRLSKDRPTLPAPAAENFAPARPAVEEPIADSAPEPGPLLPPCDHRAAGFLRPVDTDYGSQFDHSPPFRPRRNPLKIWTAAAAVFAALAIGVVAAVSYWGLPDWVPVSRPTFAMEEPDLVLEFPPDQQDRRTLPNGTEFFGASGTVDQCRARNAGCARDPDRAARCARPDRLQLESGAAINAAWHRAKA